MEKKLKSANLADLPQEFPDLHESQLEKVEDILGGKCIGHDLCHTWYEDGVHVPYYGKIVKMKGSGKNKKYVISYWSEGETLNDAVDYDLSVFAVAMDYILGDLTL